MISALDPLRDKLGDVGKQLAAAKEQLHASEREIARLRGDEMRLRVAIAKGGKSELQISEHALLRYAERVLGFNSAEVLILISRDVEPSWTMLGDGSYPVAPGFVAVVQNRVVVTIKPA